MELTIGIDPNIVEIGPFVLAWHGMLSVLAIVVGLWLTRVGLRERGLALPRFDSFAIWTIAGGIVGARLFYVLDHLGDFARNPLEIFAISEGGLAVYGAVIGGFATVALLCRRRQLPFRQIIDAIAPGLAVAQAVGRIGCLLNGDAWGARTDGIFRVVYTHPDALIPGRLLNVPTHPYPIYDMAMNLAIVAVIWPLRRRQLPAGTIFALFSLLYALTRFVISYVREERVWFWGLQEAQVVAAVLFVVSAGVLAWLATQQRRTVPV